MRHAASEFANLVNVNQYTNPPNAAQPDGTGPLIGTIDDRISGNVYQVGNELYATHSVLVGSNSAISWYKIDATTEKVIQEGVISNPAYDYFQPSIAANAAGQIVIGFTGQWVRLRRQSERRGRRRHDGWRFDDLWKPAALEGQQHRRLSADQRPLGRLHDDGRRSDQSQHLLDFPGIRGRRQRMGHANQRDHRARAVQRWRWPRAGWRRWAESLGAVACAAAPGQNVLRMGAASTIVKT